MRGQTFNATERLVTESCYHCGVLFAMTESFKSQRVDDKKTFYCPAGHGQHYTGKTDAEKERERANELERRLASANGNAQYYADKAEAERRRHAATKGQLTKTKKRIAHGICPCCNRSFANVERHMQSQHPDYAQEETVS